MSVLRRAYVEVEPDVSGFDQSLKDKLARQDPGGKAGKQVGGQLNRALKRFDLDPIDVKTDPKSALAHIAIVEARLRELSGNASTVEVKVQTERALRDLSGFRRQLGDVGDDGAGDFFARFSGRLGPLLASMPISGPMGTALAGAGAATAPLLGAAIAGGVLGGAGIGGVVGGMMLAAKDQRVQAEVDNLGDRLEGRLFKAAGVFVDPTIAGLHEIQRVADDIDLEGIFADSAKFVPTLTAGAASAVTDIGHALTGLVENAGPPVQEISSGIASIGRSAASGLASLKDNAKGGADALRTVFGVITLGINSTFMLVNALTELYEINKAIGGDLGLQTVLKLTGATMDNNTFSARRVADGMGGLSDASIQAAVSTEELKKRQEALKAVQDRVKISQDGLQRSLDALGGKSTFAAGASDALRTAMDNLYGASIRQTDANEAYQASWDDLSESVKTNKGTLDIHSAAGRANRDVLQGLLTKNNELYLANVNAGVSIDSARKKHQDRTAAVKEEARRLGLNKEETQRLIDTYGQIPGKKTTDLVLDGVREVVQALQNLYIYQRALAEGKSIASIEQSMRTGSDSGPAKRNGGYHTGGFTGEGGKYEPAGIVHRKEFVVRSEATDQIRRKHPGLLEEMNATGQVPGYARGGLVAPVDTSTRWPFTTDVSGTYVMSREQAAAKVAPSFGAWPSSPSAQRGDSGVWRQIAALIRSTGPMSGSFGNGYRPGDPKWHGSGRAVDWMGFNQDGLASFLAARRPLELIHRTKSRDYAYTRGQNKGSFNNSLMEAHRNHIHIAMDDGGFRMLQPGMNLIPNGTGRPEPIAGPAAMAAMSGDGQEAMLQAMDRLTAVQEAMLQAMVAGQDRLAPEIGQTLSRALLGTVPATRVAARQAGRRPTRA